MHLDTLLCRILTLPPSSERRRDCRRDKGQSNQRLPFGEGGGEIKKINQRPTIRDVGWHSLEHPEETGKTGVMRVSPPAGVRVNRDKDKRMLNVESLVPVGGDMFLTPTPG